jgi:hypothetical protein
LLIREKAQFGKAEKESRAEERTERGSYEEKPRSA